MTRSEESILISAHPPIDTLLHSTPLTMNCSKPNSNSSQFTPTPPGCSTGDSGFLTTTTKRSAPHSSLQPPASSSHSAEPILPNSKLTILNIKAHINLMQDDPQIIRLRIRHHHELQTRRRLVIMQFVVARPVADEVVVGAPELAHHVSEGEDGAED